MEGWNSSTTAAEVATHWSDRAAGKFFLITGGYGGLGAEDAKVLLSNGARVMIAGRSKASLDTFLESMKVHGDRVDGDVIDLANLDSVRDFAERFLAKHDSLDVLINNAGIMNTPQGLTVQGFEQQFGTNVIAPHLLTKLLLPALRKGFEGGRVINLSSLAHKIHGAARIDIERLRNFTLESSYDSWVAYQQSKLGDLLHAKALVEFDKIHAASVHPGVINTGLARTTGIWSSIKFFFHNLTSVEGFKSVEAGAATTLVAALTPDLVEGGYYVDCKIGTPHENSTFPEDVKALYHYLEEVTREFQTTKSSL